MKEITLTKQQARRFLLAHQGLCPPRRLEGKAGILTYIRRVGCIQFDPLSIVGHSPELVLQARVAGFRPEMLRELLYSDRMLLDGWDKMMSIYATDDWPYFHRYRESARRTLGDPSRPATAILPGVRKAIQERGPLSSIDLSYDQTVDWSWAPTRLARAALESMYFWGELVIHHKVHTRRVYDFADRHLPAEVLSAPDPNGTEEEYRDWHILRRLAGVGLLWDRSGDAWLGIPGVKSKERKEALARLLSRRKVIGVRVEGVEQPVYLRSEDSPYLDTATGSHDQLSDAAILAPLDNLLWDRRLVKELFDFEYRWEVYKPLDERKYGYYVLPVLQGGRFVARFEPGWDKESRTLVIKKWWWEPGLGHHEKLHADLRHCFQSFMEYLGACCLRVDDATAKQVDLRWLMP